MKKVLYPASERGHVSNGWLNSYHSFSFGHYYNENKMHFGALRVLNDDTVAPGKGFGTHPHSNMEIISIPLKGLLKHRDSMGNTSVIKAGDVQIMSAGTGITHSEFNGSESEEVKFLQIWIFPEKQNTRPHYDQITVDENKMQNQFQIVVSPRGFGLGAEIRQQAWMSLGNFDANKQEGYTIKRTENLVYMMVLEGQVDIAGEILKSRDAIGIWEIKNIPISFTEKTTLLVIEVPELT